MFSRSRINEQGAKTESARASEPTLPSTGRFSEPRESLASAQAPKAKPAASVLSSDLSVTGNLRTTGDIVIEGTIDGDIRAHLLTVGESATIRGEILADDIVINGRVIGRVRGLKVRLTSTARVEGDIIHKTIAIESGAHFEGSVQRQDDPLGSSTPKQAPQGQGQQASGQHNSGQPARALPPKPEMSAKPGGQPAPKAPNDPAKMPG
jgi:cytoskeletal protein CcmA (bactofilin family)